MSRVVSVIRGAGIATAAGMGMFALAIAAAAAGPFEGFAGSWSGSGQIKLEDGRSEGLRCHAHYATRQGGTALGLALRCASASNKIDLHADLRSTGDRVAGSWEERTFNVTGSASGRASGNSLHLAIDGGAFSGSMAVTTNGRNQSVSVRTDGAALRGINISLRHE
jgi:hypothetical protein